MSYGFKNDKSKCVLSNWEHVTDLTNNGRLDIDSDSDYLFIFTYKYVSSGKYRIAGTMTLPYDFIQSLPAPFATDYYGAFIETFVSGSDKIIFNPSFAKDRVGLDMYQTNTNATDYKMSVYSRKVQ